jgi:hypothetical protein
VPQRVHALRALSHHYLIIYRHGQHEGTTHSGYYSLIIPFCCFVMSATRRYSRNIRIYLEVLILIATTITLALTIPYAIQLWNSGPSFSVSTKSRASLIPLYGIPPLLTFLISLLNICIYIYSSQPFIYGIFIASFTSAGWLVTILLWGHCSTGSSEEDWIKWNPNICYQRNVSGYEVGVLGICGVVGGAVVLLW